MTQQYKYLHFIDYILFQRWDVKAYAFQQKVFKNAVLLREILTPYNVPLSKEKMIDKGWSIIAKINFAGELFLRAPENTKTFKGNVHEIDGETLIYSKINVRHGCVYYHPKDSIPFGVSSEYPAYKIDNKRVNGDFLVLLLQSQYFKNALSAGTSGISKARVKPNVFLDIQIPLPSLAEQNKIIAAYRATIAQAKQYSTQAKDIDKQIEKYLNISLGIEESSVKKHESGKLYFMSSNQLTRWDVWNVSTNGYSKKYPLHYLHNVIIMQSGKFLPSKAQKGGEYNVYGGNGLTGTHNEFCFTGKRIVIGRVGEYCGNVHLIDGNYWITDNALKVDKIADEVTWDFLAIALQALNINQYRSISAQPSISQTKILQLQIPIPPLHTQNEIVEHITRLRKKQKDLQQKSLTLRQQATQQFEQTIFN